VSAVKRLLQQQQEEEEALYEAFLEFAEENRELFIQLVKEEEVIGYEEV